MIKRFTAAMRVVLLACGLAAPTAVAAGESPPAAAVATAELEAEIRGELDSLRERIEDLEVLLATLVASRGVEVPSADAEPSLALAAADAGASAGSDLPAPAAQEDASAMPEGVASTGGQPLSITGLVDTYYTHNANDPADGNNTLYYTNPNARGFGLNQLKLEIETAGDGPFGFRSDIWFGSGARLFRDGLEPGPLADLLYVQQAYGYYQFGNGAQLRHGRLRDDRRTRGRRIAPELELHPRNPVGLERALLARRSAAGRAAQRHVHRHADAGERFRQPLGTRTPGSPMESRVRSRRATSSTPR